MFERVGSLSAQPVIGCHATYFRDACDIVITAVMQVGTNS